VNDELELFEIGEVHVFQRIGVVKVVCLLCVSAPNKPRTDCPRSITTASKVSIARTASTATRRSNQRRPPSSRYAIEMAVAAKMKLPRPPDPSMSTLAIAKISHPIGR
jgi:hypothetical protein